MVAGPLARLIAQLTVMGAGIVSRAFLQAYQQAAHSAKAGTQSAQQAKRVIRNKITEEEALKILDFDVRPKSMEEVVQRYDRLFNANDPKKGGSFYLQSKIFRAKERLKEEIEKGQE